MRAARCDECRAAGSAYCKHRGVLVMFVDGAPLTIVSESEERARLTADRFRVKLKGKPFNRRRTECVSSH
jgi:hypothetical protein